MKLPDASWRRQAGMAELLRVLRAKEGDARYVGGAVRDTLLGLDASDIDIATRLLPHDVLQRLKDSRIKAVPTGIEHGTVTAILPGGPVEITTLRRDVSTDGRRATVAFSSDWQEDAARRDFTINALSADPVTGEVFDYFGGLDDLGHREVRFIGDPLRRIAEDHLRILRFFRFHARFGAGTPDDAALAACTARANDLMALARERVADEMLKLLALPTPSETLTIMVDRGILRPVLPEIDPDGVARLIALEAAEHIHRVAGDPLRRFAALLPGDPETAGAVAARLRLSNKAIKRLASAARWQESVPETPELLAYKIGREEAIDRILLGGRAEAAGWIDTLRHWERPRFPLSGGDLIVMGLQPGPAVARTLQAVEAEWARAGFAADRQEVRRLAERQVAETLRAQA